MRREGNTMNTFKDNNMMKVAVIGSGIAGLSAA